MTSKRIFLVFITTFVLLTASSQRVSADYYPSGTLTSTNLLSTVSDEEVESIDSFWYNASDLGSGLRVQFSQDSSVWSGWHDCDTTGGAEIDLSGLAATADFYYRMEFSSNGSNTPVLEAVRVDYTPPPPPYTSEKTMVAKSGDSGGGTVTAVGSISPADPYVASARGWSIPTYGSVDFLTYSQLEGMYDVDSDINGLSEISDQSVHEWVGGTYEINSPPCDLAKTAVVFVNGDLTVNSNFGDAVSGDPLAAKNSCDSSLAFIVSGDITVTQGVNNIYGIFYAGGSLITESSGSQDTNDQLFVFGSLLAGDFTLARNLGADNSTSPAEQIIYMPQYLLTLKDLLGRSQVSWKEVK